MTFPVQVTWKHHDPSPAVEDFIREQAARLERYFSDIVDAHLTIETPHTHQEHGNHYLVTLDLRVPGHEFIAKRDPSQAQHEEINGSIKDAFESMKRQLTDHRGRKLAQRQASPA